MANIFIDDAVALYTCDGGSLVDSINGNNLEKDTPGEDQVVPAAGAGKEGAGAVHWRKWFDGAEGEPGFYQYERLDANLSPTFPGQSTNTEATGWTMVAWLNLNWDNWEGNVSDDTAFGFLKKGSLIGLDWRDESPATGGAYRLYAYLNGSYFQINFGALLQNGRWYHVGISLQDNGDDRTFIMRLYDATAASVIRSYSITSSWGGSLKQNSQALAFNGFITGQGHFSLNDHTDAWDEVVFFPHALSAIEIDNIRLGTYTPPGYVASPDDLPTFPAARPGGYDPDLVWQPGVPGAWGSDYVATGGGRWQEQLVAAIKGRVYYEEIT